MNILTVATTSQWRTWLSDHAATSNEVWLVIQHKTSPVPSPSYVEAVEQALCFGWIDSHARKHDAASFRLRFTAPTRQQLEPGEPAPRRSSDRQRPDDPRRPSRPARPAPAPAIGC